MRPSPKIKACISLLTAFSFMAACVGLSNFFKHGSHMRFLLFIASWFYVLSIEVKLNYTNAIIKRLLIFFFTLLKYPSKENLNKHLHFTGASITAKYAKQYIWWSSDCLNTTLGVIWGRIEDNKLAYCWSWESINSHTTLVKEITLIPSDKKAFLLLQGQELWGGELALLVELFTAIKKGKIIVCQ